MPVVCQFGSKLPAVGRQILQVFRDDMQEKLPCTSAAPCGDLRRVTVFSPVWMSKTERAAGETFSTGC